MDPDLLLVAGIVLVLLALPALLSAFSESRAPRLATILALTGGAFVVVAVRNHPAGYSLGEMPDVFLRVIGRYLH